MNFVVDANIVISVLISPTGVTAKVFFQHLSSSILYAPHYLLTELYDKKPKIMKVTGYSSEQYMDLLHYISRKIEFIEEEIIPESIRLNAFELVKGIDEGDTPYVALAQYLQLKIWTGDKELTKGLAKKGFDMCITTHHIAETLK